ncbi:unnamed protein product, partial [Laminaria digitata]
MVKLDTNGTLSWRWQNGNAGIDALAAISIGEDDIIVAAGSTDGNWNGTNVGGGTQFAAVKIDSDGTELWRWQV